MTLVIDYCGERYQPNADEVFLIGREGTLSVDENPFLHRHLLSLQCRDGVWWLANVGSRIAVTVADGDGYVQAWVSPGAQIPLVFARTSVRFSAGPTTYEVLMEVPEAAFAAVSRHNDLGAASGHTTVGGFDLTPSQRLVVIALAEQVLRQGRGPSSIPTSAQAASRLGWTQTRFNRMLDAVCQKLAASGVRGLHGSADNLASTRRGRLVEYAVLARVVTSDDLELLDRGTSSDGAVDR